MYFQKLEMLDDMSLLFFKLFKIARYANKIQNFDILFNSPAMFFFLFY